MKQRKINIYIKRKHGGWSYLCSSITTAKNFKEYINQINEKIINKKQVFCSSYDIKNSLYEGGIIKQLGRNTFLNSHGFIDLHWDKDKNTKVFNNSY